MMSPATLAIYEAWLRDAAEKPMHGQSAADIASAFECVAAGQHQTATDVTGRAWCVRCGAQA